MSIYKRGDIYWYKFMWQGQLIRESTKQSNDKTARNMESAHRTSLAQGLVEIREKKRTTVAQFVKDRFEPWAKGAFEKSSPQTWKSWYRSSIRAIEGYAPLCKRVLSDVTSEHAADFAAHIRVKGTKGKPLQASSVNARLRVLRRMFHLAVEWGELENAPKVKLLPGMSYRYVHPSEDRVLNAMELLGGHKNGHSEQSEAKEERRQLQETNENSAA